MTFPHSVAQKSRVQAAREKRLHLAAKGSVGIATALKFSRRTWKGCQYRQAFLHVFWHKLISLPCFMLAHFVHQTSRHLLSSSTPPLISCFFSKIRKRLCFSRFLGYLGNQFCLRGARLDQGLEHLLLLLKIRIWKLTLQRAAHLEGTLDVSQPKEDAPAFKTIYIHTPGEFMKKTFHY